MSTPEEDQCARFQLLMQQLDGINSDYTGPAEIRSFADFLPFIGEVVIAFALLERRLTWALESCLRIGREEADAIQETVMSVTTRIGMLATLAARHVSNDDQKRNQLSSIVEQLKGLNAYRNQILHGPWYGISGSMDAEGNLIERAAMKSKFARLGAEELSSKERSHTKQEMRERAQQMIDLCLTIQVWVLSTFPHAENRVP